MLRIDVLMENIQYEKNFNQLLLKLGKKFGQMESDSLMIRIFQKMGDDFPRILSGVLEGFSENDKNKLLCDLIQSFGPEQIRWLNSELAENSLGQHFRIKDVSAERGDGYICLTLSSVAVDYSGLLQNRDVQEKLFGLLHGCLDRFSGIDLTDCVIYQAMNCAASLVRVLPDAGEQAVLSILDHEGVQKAVLRLTEDTLRKNGLYLQHLALRIQPDSQPA